MAYLKTRQETVEGLLQSVVYGLNTLQYRTHKGAVLPGDGGA